MWKLPKPQLLAQRGARDCSVSVFAQLSGTPEEQLRRELPSAVSGQISVDEWIVWLQGKGLDVVKRRGCPDDMVPCAHLVGNMPQSVEDFHWVFRDIDGNVHDPSPVFMYFPADDPRMKTLDFYSEQVLTITVTRGETP